MRKIRGFRLALHPKELRRRLRRFVNLQACGVDDEASFERHDSTFTKRIQPAVVFDSLGPESKETAKISPIPGLAHTIVRPSPSLRNINWPPSLPLSP